MPKYLKQSLSYKEARRRHEKTINKIRANQCLIGVPPNYKTKTLQEVQLSCGPHVVFEPDLVVVYKNGSNIWEIVLVEIKYGGGTHTLYDAYTKLALWEEYIKTNPDDIIQSLYRNGIEIDHPYRFRSICAYWIGSRVETFTPYKLPFCLTSILPSINSS